MGEGTLNKELEDVTLNDFSTSKRTEVIETRDENEADIYSSDEESPVVVPV